MLHVHTHSIWISFHRNTWCIVYHEHSQRYWSWQQSLVLLELYRNWLLHSALGAHSTHGKYSTEPTVRCLHVVLDEISLSESKISADIFPFCCMFLELIKQFNLMRAVTSFSYVHWTELLEEDVNHMNNVFV